MNTGTAETTLVKRREGEGATATGGRFASLARFFIQSSHTVIIVVVAFTAFNAAIILRWDCFAEERTKERNDVLETAGDRVARKAAEQKKQKQYNYSKY